MMGTVQAGMESLRKLRTGNQQTVVVQHVQVGSGGQAVVAGHVERKGAGDAGE
jgi:hypothetical protein